MGATASLPQWPSHWFVTLATKFLSWLSQLSHMLPTHDSSAILELKKHAQGLPTSLGFRDGAGHRILQCFHVRRGTWRGAWRGQLDQAV